MAQRQIIRVNEELCDGCGLCVQGCPEGALKIVNGKAVLVSEPLCDGLGACIGDCPRGAIAIETREADGYSERDVIANIIPKGAAAVKNHLEHLRHHGLPREREEAEGYIKECSREVATAAPPANREDRGDGHGHGCPGARAMQLGEGPGLRQWPIQLSLVPVTAPYLEGAEILLAADCAGFAYPGFQKLIREESVERVLLIGCPKLDDLALYEKKLTGILAANAIRSVVCVRMEVPCCSGLVRAAKAAVAASGRRDLEVKEIVISVDGKHINQQGGRDGNVL
ncbi:MAG: 4Fe-4S binding protein [Candidatus Omnitrophica bacterium]|nr:4Fe-4S binding protein [Candidatus Omnitrophota bacterium]